MSPLLPFTPIGIFKSSSSYKQEAPRQGVFAGTNPGLIQLAAARNFEMALRDLDGFERIWVLYLFDRNQGWRPTTRPPIPLQGQQRVGVFASRSPYRPNPIGMSSVRLVSIQGLSIQVEEADLLDGTPILDIKPYIPAFDSFPDARSGWLEQQVRETWLIDSHPLFLEQQHWLRGLDGPDLQHFCDVQLSTNPWDCTRKRIRMLTPNGTQMRAELSFRTWRILLQADPESRNIHLEQIASGYSKAELADEDDPYCDKALHRSYTIWTGKRIV